MSSDKKPGRFIVVDHYDKDITKYDDPEDLYWEESFQEPSYLVDTTTNAIVYSDAMEPEDRYLFRSLSPLVDLLNEVAKGN